MEKQIKVSIILPTYNGGKYVINAVESVLFQSFSDWELIIINDGSNDDTESLLEKYIKKEPRIIYLKNEKKIGVQKTLNKGIKKSKGEYIARIDDDDEWINKDKLKEQIEFLEKNNDYVLVGTNGVVVDDRMNRIIDYNVPKTDFLIRKTILFKNSFISSSVLIRKSVLQRIGGYCEEEYAKNVEDYNLWLRLGTLGKFFNFDGVMTSYMMREGNISSNNKKDILKKNLHIIAIYKKEYPNYKKALFFSYFKFITYNTIFLIKNKKLKNKVIKFLFKRYRKFSF